MTRLRPAPQDAAPVRGFTLVELLVVITIIAILAGFLLTTVLYMNDSARSAKASRKINELVNAMEQYKGEFRAYPPLDDGDDGVLSKEYYDMKAEDVVYYFLQHGYMEGYDKEGNYANDNVIFDRKRKRKVKGFVKYSNEEYVATEWSEHPEGFSHQFLRDPWNAGGDDTVQVYRFSDAPPEGKDEGGNEVDIVPAAYRNLDYYIYCVGPATITDPDQDEFFDPDRANLLIGSWGKEDYDRSAYE